jgi:hypothetical protein
VLPDEPLGAALADAIAFGKLPLPRARGDEPFRVRPREPVANPPLRVLNGADRTL